MATACSMAAAAIDFSQFMVIPFGHQAWWPFDAVLSRKTCAVGGEDRANKTGKRDYFAHFSSRMTRRNHDTAFAQDLRQDAIVPQSVVPEDPGGTLAFSSCCFAEQEQHHDRRKTRRSR
jgi:hypothetical protein